MKPLILSIFIFINLSMGAPIEIPNDLKNNFDTSHGLNKIGDYPYPNDPLLDRAKGYLLKGKVKTAVSNSGNFITLPCPHKLDQS